MENHEDTVIELGSVLDQTKGAAQIDADSDGSPRVNGLGILAE